MKTKARGIKFIAFLLLVSIFSVGIFLSSPDKAEALGGGTVTYQATDDAVVYNGTPDQNYGALPFNMAAYGGGDDIFFYVKFQDFNLPADATITSAKIKLTNAECFNPESISVRRVTASWGENTITYGNRPSYTTTGGTTLMPNCATATWLLDATAIATTWQAGTQPNYGVLIWGPSWGSYTYLFDSTESGTAATKPQLQVTYTTPDPAPVVVPPPAPDPGPASGSTPASPSATSTTPGTNTAETTVLVPKLTEIEVNEVKIEQRTTSITVKDDDKVIVRGNAPANSKVIVTVDDKEFNVTADKYGDWELKIDTSDFKDGKYDVYAKAVTADNKESEKVKLFDFEKKKNEATVKAKEEANFYKKNMPYIIGGGLVLLLIIAVLTGMYIKKHKHVKRLLENTPGGPTPPAPPAPKIQ